MKEIKAPKNVYQGNPPYLDRFLFLAGSIEMGIAENWQEKVARELSHSVWTLLNPRRDDWDNSWEQSLEDERFVEQVSWELQGMEIAEKILMYFSPETKAPITLLEFGLWANNKGNKPSKLIVVCPEGFWRKGNVDVVCARYNVSQFKTLDEAIKELKNY